MDQTLPTQGDIDELLAFLPVFSAPNFVPAPPRPPMKLVPGAVIELYDPGYVPEVYAFFNIASKPVWTDKSYVSKNAGAVLDDPSLLAKVALEEVRTLLTHFVRGERFCSGTWGSAIESGQLVRLLARVKQLRDTLG